MNEKEKLQISDAFRKRLRNADNVLFFTGAGISSESGVPTFRGESGLWKKFRPEELANFDAFLRNPDLVWNWYQFRRKIIRNAKPNSAHKAIVEFEKFFADVTVVTQNVDNLHNRAGSKNVLELHGNIERNYCIECGKRYDYVEFPEIETVPKCEKCGGKIRPDVVWFGETLPMEIFREAERKAAQADICFVIGTSAVVYPAAGIAYRAKEFGAFLVEINPQVTDLSSLADETFHEKAGTVLPALLERLKEEMKK